MAIDHSSGCGLQDRNDTRAHHKNEEGALQDARQGTARLVSTVLLLALTGTGMAYAQTAHRSEPTLVPTDQLNQFTLFTDITEYFVAQGWLGDMPALSGGFYAEEMDLAKKEKRGIWQLIAMPGATRDAPKTDAEWHAVAIAEAEIARTYPYFKTHDNHKLVIIDRADEWEVTYDFIQATLGGSPHVFIEKKSGAVTKIYTER